MEGIYQREIRTSKSFNPSKLDLLEQVSQLRVHHILGITPEMEYF